VHRWHTVEHLRLGVPVAGDAHRAGGAAVEAALEGDDLTPPGGDFAEFDGRLDAGGAGGSAEVHAHPVAHLLGKHLQLQPGEAVLRPYGQVEPCKGRQLILDGGDDLGMTVAEGEHPRRR